MSVLLIMLLVKATDNLGCPSHEFVEDTTQFDANSSIALIFCL